MTKDSKRVYNYCLDNECEEIMKKIPSREKSEFIRTLIKNSQKHEMKEVVLEI